MSREFDYAMELKKNGNVEEAKAYFEKAAQGGEPEAYMELARLAVPEAGEHYYNYSKLDVTLLPQGYHKTEFEYYLKASELGHTRAMVYVGIAYKQGYLVNRDYDMAFNCFAKATELGDDYLAPYYLAECYENALGTEMDENAAVLYYTMCAEHGNIPAMLALARIYKDFEKLANECRFSTCLHINEPDCAVKNAVTHNIIDKRRYDNYLHLVKEIKDGKQVWRKK